MGKDSAGKPRVSVLGCAPTMAVRRSVEAAWVGDVVLFGSGMSGGRVGMFWRQMGHVASNGAIVKGIRARASKKFWRSITVPAFWGSFGKNCASGTDAGDDNGDGSADIAVVDFYLVILFE